MKNLRATITAVLVLTALPGSLSAQALRIQDDRGKLLVLAQPAQRIVALAPHVTELLYAAGAGDKLAAVTQYSDYPPAARALPRVGDATRVDMERILALAPDLVVAWRSGNSAADLERIERMGIKVFVTEAIRLADIPRLLRTLGALAATQTQAQRAAMDFERELAALESSVKPGRAAKVFYEIWHRPLMTVNGRHIISDVIRTCGGWNVFAAVPLLTPVISLESVVAAAPDFILGGGSAASAADFTAGWRGFPYLAAVAHQHVYFVDPDLIQRPTPRILEGARIVCAVIGYS
jgi:iron complex transport system substrate-binding protein